MLPMCADMGVGCVPYSPQGKGGLTRPWGSRPTGRPSMWWRSLRPGRRPAGRRRGPARCRGPGIPMSQVALAWLLAKPVVSAPIVGATKPHHLADAAAAVAITLTEDEIRQLEEPYTPQARYWW